jgi:hypothetical protein
LSNLKHKTLLKSFRFRLLIVFLLIVLAVLFYFLRTRSNDSQLTGVFQTKSENSQIHADLGLLKLHLSQGIDSILFSFGIKKEWINTSPASQEPGRTTGKKVKEPTNVQWFEKNVLIPKDLTTAEVNLDISQYIESIGLITRVTEDIKTTSVNISIYDPLDSTSLKNILPLAGISVSHGAKIKRDGGIIVLILKGIGEYKHSDAAELLSTADEFSYIFPRSTDEIDLQNKLLQMKKDVVMQLTVGNPDNPEADFRIEQNDKEIKQRVKSINSDFPAIKNMILTKHEPSVHYLKLYPFLKSEFKKYNVTLFADTIITPLLAIQEEDSKDKINIMADKMRSLAFSGKLISIIAVSYDEFKQLYEQIFVLKKLGYKFYTFSNLIEREERLRKETEAKLQSKEIDKKKEQKENKQFKKKK